MATHNRLPVIAAVAASIFAVPAVGCDLDGYGGHRFFAFGMKAGAPQPQSDPNDLLSRLDGNSSLPPVSVEPTKVAVVVPVRKPAAPTDKPPLNPAVSAANKAN